MSRQIDVAEERTDQLYRMQDETSRIEDALLEKASVDAILRAFSQAKSASFENMLEPLLKVAFCAYH